jgi:hypothetical protein
MTVALLLVACLRSNQCNLRTITELISSVIILKLHYSSQFPLDNNQFSDCSQVLHEAIQTTSDNKDAEEN